jgi:hypothetical protein
MSAAAESNNHTIHLGLGEAIQRLVRVAIMRSQGVHVDGQLAEEEGMIVQALNQHDALNLGFDCNMDGIPDSIEIFAKSAETSCCRLVEDDKPSQAKVRGSSRYR